MNEGEYKYVILINYKLSDFEQKVNKLKNDKYNIERSLDEVNLFNYEDQKIIFNHLMNINNDIKNIRQKIYKLYQIKNNIKFKIPLRGNFINNTTNKGNSYPERIIYKYLQKLIINKFILYFEHDKLLPIKFKKPLRADFYIIDNQINFIIIEFNGSQHYSYNKLFHKNISIHTIKNRDNKKKLFCKQNNIKYLEIPFYTENILETIYNFLFPK